MVKIGPQEDNSFAIRNNDNNKKNKVLKYEYHNIIHVQAKDPGVKDINNLAHALFEIPEAPPAPIPDKVKIHPKSSHLTDEITKTFTSRKVVDIKKIEKLDTEATKKRLDVAKSEYVEEKGQKLGVQNNTEKEATKEKHTESQHKSHKTEGYSMKGTKKPKEAHKSQGKQAEVPEKKGAARSSLAAYMQQASEEKKERDKLNQELESKKESREDDQKKIDTRFDKETRRK